jgi:hypothetical protein
VVTFRAHAVVEDGGRGGAGAEVEEVGEKRCARKGDYG